jgi:lysophospholipase L1-like esterase
MYLYLYKLTYMLFRRQLYISAVIPFIFFSLSLANFDANGQPKKKNFHIVFIGNSITEGTGLPDRLTQAPPIRAGEKLSSLKNVGNVQVKNAGKSGSTTLDWLPSKKLFLNAESLANSFASDSANAQLVFSLVLGTNDSAMKGPHGAPVSPDDYHANLMAIADRLLSDFPDARLIFQYPTWYSENTYNTSMYLKEGLQRLQSYFPQIDDVVKRYRHTHPGRVFTGNKKVFKYFKQHPELFRQEKGQQGIFNLHPNVQGATDLGNFWARAIYKVMR